MDIQILLDKMHPVYTNQDQVSGHVILRNEAELDIATITIKLSGSATSRLDSGKLTESHELFTRSEQILPPGNCAGLFTSRAVTIPPGEHSFPFSIMFPQVSECYKSNTTDATRKRPSSHEPHHLLRKLPPSAGNRRTPEEISYVLEASIVQDGLIRRTHATRDISIHPVSTIRQPFHTLKARTSVTCNTTASGRLSPPLIYDIEAELVNGPFLLLGHPIALATLLLETTEVRACGSMQSFTRPWVIQTMTNLRRPLVAGRGPTVGSVLNLDGSLWSRHRVPLHLTPTFETCNISRNYKLEVRLGIDFGQNNTRIVELHFPAYVLSPSLRRSDVRSQPAEKELKLEFA
ncbi:hypothetical protein BDV23DRAFT_173412 [Aspergillus alliaceus]|uniref:Arrestin-like N-terminal domain-containing protein n=1 Tax=Petromyces alliaceus TaxID=209559 RepID=A0A5N7C653_PETAA|nr:hypothetical protein BDV23DRAFT_173412 [Aspergillus alliaceus]